MKVANQHEVFERRRMYPRLVLLIPVKICLQAGVNVDAQLQDISPDGMQIRCNEEIATSIKEGCTRTGEKRRPSILLEFELPGASALIKINVECSICYVVTLKGKSSNNIAFGLQFKQFKGKSLQEIQKFFLNELDPS